MMSAPSPKLQQMPLLTGRNILIVEDEYYLADDIEQAFRRLGADIVGPVGDVHDALSILSAGDVINGAVLDINVRDEMIFPVAQELRARQVPFVFTSGYDRVISSEFANVPLWEKPINVGAMARELAEMILTP